MDYKKEYGIPRYIEELFYRCVRDLLWRVVLEVCKRPAMEKRSDLEVLYRLYFVPIVIHAAETRTGNIRETRRVEDMGIKFIRNMISIKRLNSPTSSDTASKTQTTMSTQSRFNLLAIVYKQHNVFPYYSHDAHSCAK
uniref:Uncharacterized protein n=1 Tax=Timema cristinae TaxID=61476 RepID=A0A7R9H5Z1_TIMCR|nr:unnamed protein product [Timema cristinae]